ncbi:hypothetical protein [Methanobrevibacter sp.]|uniref:hypothetical protein n=1 Tax=Methanobrevibacter sp. TaxID=66852 RepID=UPI0025CD80B4|nr:hypothetical protein [Methanobrevibacter sp.]MBQ2832592.1 hypothetical protein [Methanobrevibacter sp.]
MTEKYIIKYHPKFDKEVNKLMKKCPSLKEDFERLTNVLLFHLKTGDHYLPDDQYLQLQRLNVPFPVFKIKKFRCKDIPKGNRSGFRFIFILSRKHHVIYFTECYFKRSNEIENRNRIRKICLNYEKYFNE